MPIATQLLREIQAFGDRNPKNHKSVSALMRAVIRIDAEFSGETRDQLLGEARKTFLRQVETLENAQRTVVALEQLKQNQRELVEGLKRIASRRPVGTTLH